MRDYRVRTANKAKEHKTGRICDTPGCKGELKDTIINFGEGLKGEILQDGFVWCALSDLVLIMGSSMRVSPACDMPLCCIPSGGKVVIVNLQKTPCHPIANLNIHAKCDDVMKMLMEKLDVPIPEFRRKYRLKVSLSEDGKNVLLTGIDGNGACYTLFKQLKVTGLSQSFSTLPDRVQKIQPYRLAIQNKNA